MKKSSFYFFFFNLLLSLLGSVFFALAHSNYLFLRGLPVLAYPALIPFFLLIKRTRGKCLFLWGAFSGFFSYFLFNFWIIFFHQAAIYFVTLQYALLYALLFPVIKILYLKFPRYSFLMVSMAWVGFEYVKTLGFTGYSYGIMAYTQWQFPFLIRTASIFGVWGLSFLIALFSSIFSLVLYEAYFIYGKSVGLKKAFFMFKKPFCLWCFMFFLFILYGILSYKSYDDVPKKAIALIQPNKDPWIGNIEVYRQNFEELKDLSERAIKENENLSLVVWPETAFIPRIKWHYRYGQNAALSQLVRELLRFIDSQTVPFLIGNDEGVLMDAGKPPSEDNRLDYNAALLFFPKKNVIPPEPESYRKMHLVPFTESFPYKKQFSWIYNFLENSDTHFWAMGEKPSIFDLQDFKFGVPICFEDTFGYISARFVKNGANLIINITNDAWAKSLTAQYQHLGMAVFRAVENRVPLIRAAASGQTACISPNGELTAMVKAFTSSYLIAEVPILTKHTKTVYTHTGDFFGAAALFFTAAALIICILKIKLRIS